MTDRARRRILIVDDELRVARTLGIALGEHETAIAGGGHEAMGLLEAQGPYDLVVCDLMMPEMSGMDLYELVKARWPGQERRFVFMTGGAFTDRAARFLAGVPNARLEKPFRVDELAALVEAAPPG